MKQLRDAGGKFKALEKDIQEEIVNFLTMEGWQVFVFAPPGNRRGGLAGSVPTGWPDLLAIWPKHLPASYIHVEVKRPGEKLSHDQQDMHSLLWNLGQNVVTVSSAEEMAEQLTAWGFPVRTQFPAKEVQP